MANIFDKFQPETKKVKIKALDDAEVTIREQSVFEANEFYKKILDGLDEEGNPKIDVSAITDMTLQKVSTCMIEPKMTIEQLQTLSGKANKAITEISEAIDKISGDSGN